MTEPGDALPRFVRWVRDEALPVWADRGFDAAAWRFHERLDLSGRPLSVPHRAMVQARQIYVFAHAGRAGWFPGGADIAARAMASLRREFCTDESGCTSAHFSIDAASGAPHSQVRDAYTHAFLLFAVAHLYRATHDRALLRFADGVVRYLDESLVDVRHGGLMSDAGSRDAEKLQNPQMHCLEAYLALAEAAPDGDYLDRAARLVALFRDRMIRRDTGILPERFAIDWDVHPDPAVATVFEPGHHFEWVWLLRWYEDLSGTHHDDCREMLLRTATAAGCAVDGRIFDQMAPGGRVLRAAHRLWPHCEAIKAATAGDLGLRDPDAMHLADRAADVLLCDFLDRPFAGGWIDQIGVDGGALVDYVPASSLYHLFLAAIVADGALVGIAHPRSRPVHA